MQIQSAYLPQVQGARNFNGNATAWQPSFSTDNGSLDFFQPSLQVDNSWLAMRELSRNFHLLAGAAQNQNFDNIGLACRDWGLYEPQVNPLSGTDCWSGNAWDWARGALEAAGSDIPALDAPNSRQAYTRLEKAEQLSFGNPPPGALVFVPKKNGGYRLGFANPDGNSYRSAVPASRSERGIGDRQLRDAENVAWMMPPAAATTSKHHKAINPRAIHMTQTYDRRYNPTGDGTSGDCVCTSLAMGLKALGKGVKGNPQEQIDKVRYAMTHGVRNDRDGYDKNGNRSHAEHELGTDPYECQRGAERLGVNAKGRAHSVKDAMRAVQNGHPVVLFGENSSKLWGDAHGLFHFNGKHGVLLSGYDEKTKMFTINDPLSHHGPIQVSAKTLSKFHFAGEKMLGVILKPKNP